MKTSTWSYWARSMSGILFYRSKKEKLSGILSLQSSEELDPFVSIIMRKRGSLKKSKVQKAYRKQNLRGCRELNRNLWIFTPLCPINLGSIEYLLTQHKYMHLLPFSLPHITLENSCPSIIGFSLLSISFIC